jgi:hypothetical protein
MLVTERRVTHVGQFDVAFRAGIHEQVAVQGVELGCSNDFGKLLHVDWLDVHDVYIAEGMAVRHKNTQSERHTETSIADVQVPQVDSKVISRDVRFLIRVDRNGMYVIRMGVGVDFAGDSGDDIILLHHAWQTEM